MALSQCLKVQEYRAVTAVCLDSSQKAVLNHGDKFSTASLKPFVLVNCSSEKVTLSRALTKAEWKKSGCGDHHQDLSAFCPKLTCS